MVARRTIERLKDIDVMAVLVRLQEIFRRSHEQSNQACDLCQALFSGCLLVPIRFIRLIQLPSVHVSGWERKPTCTIHVTDKSKETRKKHAHEQEAGRIAVACSYVATNQRN